MLKSVITDFELVIVCFRALHYTVSINQLYLCYRFYNSFPKVNASCFGRENRRRKKTINYAKQTFAIRSDGT